MLGLRKRWIGLTAAAAALAGIGVFTFTYAKGVSYVSNDPKACMNCHVMREHYSSWVKASHHKAATCNDCHTPHTFPGKWIAKARNGWNHSRAFTAQDYPEPIRITKANLEALQTNCLHCHEMMTSEISAHRGFKPGTARCTDCHRSVGHMNLD